MYSRLSHRIFFYFIPSRSPPLGKDEMYGGWGNE